MSNDFPVTVDAAVRLLIGMVPESEQAKIAAMTEGDLVMLHIGLGQWIRNHLGLWGDNPVLMQATGEQEADDASAVIVLAFWQWLRDQQPKMH